MAGLLSTAQAVFRAWGQGGAAEGSVQDSPEGGPVVNGDATQQPEESGQGRKGLPDFDYPASPWVVKNSFLHVGDRLNSLDGFYQERPFQSTPAHTLESAWPQDGEEDDSSVLTKAGEVSPEVDGASSCHSTSAGLSPPSSGTEDSPGRLTEASPTVSTPPPAAAGALASEPDMGTLQVPTVAELTPQKVSPRPLSEKLPQIEYPGLFTVKNTFIEFSPESGVDKARSLHSCPVSLIKGPEDLNLIKGPEETLVPSALPEGVAPLFEPAILPPPPAEPPVLPATADQSHCGVAEAPSAPPKATPLSLSAMLGTPALGTPGNPTLGSADHYLGTCKPCAHAHTSKGCRNGLECQFCHLCPPGELKRQQKAKRLAQRTGRQE